MYADSDEDDGYVAYNGNKGVNGGNGGGNAGEYYVPNDDAVILSPNTLVFGGNGNDTMILSPNTLVFGGNGHSPSAHQNANAFHNGSPRFHASQAVQLIQPSFRSFLEGQLSSPKAQVLQGSQVLQGLQGPQASSSRNSSGQRQRSLAAGQDLVKAQ